MSIFSVLDLLIFGQDLKFGLKFRSLLELQYLIYEIWLSIVYQFIWEKVNKKLFFIIYLMFVISMEFVIRNVKLLF